MLIYIPLEDATLSEVLARVTYQLIALEWRRSSPSDFPHRAQVTRTVERKIAPYFPALCTWLAACDYDCSRTGIKTHLWRRNVVERARRAAYNRRIGKPWRR